MRIFLDTEFIEDGKTIELVSIGLVAEDGRTLYMENQEADLGRANNWVKANVLPNLTSATHSWPKYKIKEWLLDFCGREPEFWGYFADYDWVVVCQLFGNMTDLPGHWPMFCMDVKQWAKQLGVSSDQLHQVCDNKYEIEHHALSDAKWIANAWYYLHGYSLGRG